MKKVIGTMLFTTAICGFMAVTPAHAGFFSTNHAYYGNGVTSRSVTQTRLTRSDVISIQSSLAAKGFYRGPIDGKWGPMTASALSSFQSSQGLAANGLPTSETLAMLNVRSSSSVVYGAPQDIEPAAGGEVVESTTTTDVYRTRATGGFVAIDTNNVNGSTCLTCTNGIVGNGGTPSMRSNEY